MAIETLTEVKEKGWLNGFSPLWRKENHALWAKLSWLTRILVWVVIVDGLMAVLAFTSPRTGGIVPVQDILSPFFIIAAMIPAASAIIFSHEDIIDERKLGTAAWVLSKPVSRASFLLAKLAAYALNTAATLVIPQGIVAYFLFRAATGIELSVPGFAAGIVLVYLFVMFFQALCLMLGTFFHSRGPVIGIPLVLICLSYPAAMVPSLGQFMPSAMFLSLGKDQASLAYALALGQPAPTLVPLIGTFILLAIFIVAAIWRFRQEEF